MEFVMEMAGAEQIEELVEIMEDAARNVQKKEWFAAGDRACLLDALLGNSFVILARERESREAAGFFAVLFPEEKEEYMTAMNNCIKFLYGGCKESFLWKRTAEEDA